MLLSAIDISCALLNGGLSGGVVEVVPGSRFGVSVAADADMSVPNAAAALASLAAPRAPEPGGRPLFFGDMLLFGVDALACSKHGSLVAT